MIFIWNLNQIWGGVSFIGCGPITITTTDHSASTSTSISPKEEPIKTEQMETSNQSQQMRQSPYATRQRNIKDKWNQNKTKLFIACLSIPLK